jgi:hypothetical protein
MGEKVRSKREEGGSIGRDRKIYSSFFLLTSALS